MLAVAINMYIGPQLNITGKLIRRTQMLWLAKAGMKRAILELKNDETQSYDALSDSWNDNGGAFMMVTAGAGTFSVVKNRFHAGPGSGNQYGLVDEERKININKATYDVLKNLFETVAETISQDAEEIADSIIDWRDEDDEARDNGAEDGYYSMRVPGYRCKNGDFIILEELLLVKGVTPEIFDKVRERVTVYGAGAVNINTADEIVLRVLGMDEELSGKFMDFRAGNYEIEGDEEPGEGVFENTESIATTLAEAIKLSNDEVTQLARIFAAGVFTVRSDNFTGCSVGQVAERSDSVCVRFMFDRKEQLMKHWRES